MKSAKNTSRAAPEPPKKALTAFFLFREQVYDDVKKDNPDARVTEITKIISEMWNNLDTDEKEKLSQQYRKNKEKYNK